MHSTDPLDRVLAAATRGLQTLAVSSRANRPYPASSEELACDRLLGAEQLREAAALMRVNHVGEVCAQALYEAQALGSQEPETRRALLAAAAEEGDHLAWTQRRMTELGGRPSLLNPLWYAGAFAIGLLAARAGDRISLGFVSETERQVEQHLASHLEQLPADDRASRAIVRTMAEDEKRHGDDALARGGADLPWWVRGAMRVAARVMTTTAHRI